MTEKTQHPTKFEMAQGALELATDAVVGGAVAGGCGLAGAAIGAGIGAATGPLAPVATPGLAAGLGVGAAGACAAPFIEAGEDFYKTMTGGHPEPYYSPAPLNTPALAVGSSDTKQK